MKASLLLVLVMLMSGCGATTQMAQVHQTQKHPDSSCHLQVTYNCPQPVVGQPYSCTPTVTQDCN